MDTQKLGRALGYGTRHAAKTIAAVAEAAAAPDPRRPVAARPVTSPEPASRPVPPSAPAAAGASRQSGTAGNSRPARGLWAPLATFSSALWLRVTGLFFGLLAMSLGTGAWRLRDTVTAGTGSADQRHHFWIFLLFTLLFSYFAASSFLRATLRERRDARR